MLPALGHPNRQPSSLSSAGSLQLYVQLGQQPAEGCVPLRNRRTHALQGARGWTVSAGAPVAH
jgi:hypothetical protein